MSSFFEKLKRGMGIEETIETEEEAEEEVKKKIQKPERTKKPQKEKQIKKLGVNSSPSFKAEPITGSVVESQPEKSEQEKTEQKKESEIIEKPRLEEEKPAKTPQKEKWFEPEGELAIDVYQTENDLVIQSAIAGVKPENLEITLEGDRITIRGARKKPFEESGDYFTQECYWGPFSREIILPVEVDPNQAEAEMREGILTIRIPKIQKEKKRKIIVRG